MGLAGIRSISGNCFKKSYSPRLVSQLCMTECQVHTDQTLLQCPSIPWPSLLPPDLNNRTVKPVEMMKEYFQKIKSKATQGSSIILMLVLRNHS